MPSQQLERGVGIDSEVLHHLPDLIAAERGAKLVGYRAGSCKPKSTSSRHQGAHHSPSILSTKRQKRILIPANQGFWETSANIGHE
jgi:hypothetical protein